MRRLWRRHRAFALMNRHERWRVAMGCPGIPRPAPGRWPVDPNVPIRGEVYCRCERCHAARALVGWDAL